MGRITQKNETIEGSSTSTVYVYDDSGRLDQVIVGGIVTFDYQYDNNDNRTHVNGVLLGTYDEQDRLNSYEDNTYSYNDDGQLVSKTHQPSSDVTTYNYDNLGNLVSVNLPATNTVEYVVDGRNRRIGKKLDGTLVQGFLYADQLNPIAELDSQGNLVSRFIYADKINVPAYMIKNGDTYRIVSDHLGSPRLVINLSDGSITQRIDYDEWGNVINDTNPGFQPFGFAGGLYDQDTRLVRFGARDYDPEIGRWTSKDPILFNGGPVNLFGYSVNDPVNYIDTNGNVAFNLAGSVAGAIVGGVTAAINGGDAGTIALAAITGAVTGAITGGR